MKLLSVCCVLFTITITATCLQRDSRYQQILDRRAKQRLMKRDASLLVDTSPIDVDPVYRMPPVVTYRRLSRTRLPSRPKQPPRYHKATNKYKKPVKPKYSSGGYKKKSTKPRYYRKRPISKKPYSSPPKYTKQFAPHQPEPVGFGEPPVDFRNEYPSRPIPPSYKEELLDSYGTPISPSDIEDFPPIIHPAQYNKELENPRPGFNSWQNQNSDTALAYSRKRPIYERPEYETQDIDPDEIYNDYIYRSPAKPNYNLDPNPTKYVRKPWNVKSQRAKEVDDEIIVGGQYAEPPARYVPKFQPSAPMYDNDEEFAPPHRLIHPEITVSATNSPYVNYKHSNMAFSPQNLNDAFSIVEK